jgi:hypothetical protein
MGMVLSGAACGEQEAVNRVQTGAMPKSFFLGDKLGDATDDPEFYFRTTVVDVPAGAGPEGLFTQSDSQPTVRMRWEITEDKLIARLSYELINNTDKTGSLTPHGDDPRKAKEELAPRRTTDGQIVAAFRIEKQFDVRREYNAQTGEESNVVLENDTDRRWFDREFIRVDWSKNLIDNAYDLDAFSQLGLYGGVTWNNMAYYVSDTGSPDAPVIDIKNGYFDVTAKAFAAPQMIHDEEFGDFPACFLLSSYPQTSCNTAEVKLRLSFKRVVDNDYEPMDFDGRRMDMFGYFTNDRFGYDRRYGVVDDRWHRFASRWNVWEKSHADAKVACATEETTPAGASPHRDADQNGTEDECEKVGRGSRCDEFKHSCTIPLRDRKVKPVIWHTNRGFPESLYEGSKKVVQLWSDSVRVGILAGRMAECRRTGEGGCEAKFGWPSPWYDNFVPPVGDDGPAKVPAVFVLCHNPVDTEKDDAVCGKEPISPRLGDLRFNLFSLIESPQVSSPWGIMMDAEDPLTGEKIAGSVNQWSGVLDRAAGSVTDIVQVLNGEIPPTKFIDGENVSNWIAEQARAPKAMGAQEVAERMSAFDPKAIAGFQTGPSKAESKRMPAAAKHKARMNALSSVGREGAGNAAIAARMAKLKGTEIEGKLLSKEVLQLAGLDPNAPITRAAAERASPFSGKSNPIVRRAMDKHARLGRSQRHSCRREAPDADNVLTVARAAQKLFGVADPNDAEAVRKHRDQIFNWAKERYSIGVFSHELGHSVGLRHNFAGTFDSLSYEPEYWQLRTKNATVTKACASGNTDGASCVGPRYNDPITDAERDGGISQYASSSVMDYPGDQALDMFTIGKYDRAAVRFGYGGTVDVWSDPGLSVQASGDGQRKAYEALAFGDSVGLFGVFQFPQPSGADYKYMHYSQYAAEFGLIRDCVSDDTSPVGSRCAQAPLDVVDYRDMQDFVSDPLYPDYTTSKKAVDAQGRVRRGYMFSSDEFADSGNVPSFAYDAGADPYEQVRFLEQAYENRYLTDAFRRNRTTFNSEAVVYRVQSHYLDTIQNISKTFGFGMVLDGADASKPTAELMADGYYGPLAMASTVGLELFTRALTRPEPGPYCSTALESCPNVRPFGLEDDIFAADPVKVQNGNYAFNVPLGVGRYVHNDFDYSQGYWWGDYQKQVGSYYDKIWSLYYLSEAFDTFIANSREDFVDGRYKNINFATVYPVQMQRLYSSLLTGDLMTYAPWTEASGAGTNAEVKYPPWRNLAPLSGKFTSAKVMDPSWGFGEQLYAMVWGTMLLPTSWQDSFINDARIVARAGEAVTWPAAETTTFVDPDTGITYRARSTGLELMFGVEHEKSVGARMLEWANTLVLEAYLVDIDAQGFYKFNADGTPKLTLKDGKPQLNPDFPGSDAALKRYVVNIEIMRQLVSTFVRPLDTSAQ